MTPEEALAALEQAGLIAWWWCANCDDKVWFRTGEMTEQESRTAHNRHAAYNDGGSHA